MPRTIKRWMWSGVFALLGLMPSGCIVTDWRWIWEDENDHNCQKIDFKMPGMSMSMSVPANQ